MPLKELNITVFMIGLKGQVSVHGRFKTKKAIVEALDCSAHFFNGYASMTLGTVGRVLVEKHGDNILIATPNNLAVLDHDLYKRDRKIVTSFTYWVQIAPGEWETHRYEVEDDGS